MYATGPLGALSLKKVSLLFATALLIFSSLSSSFSPLVAHAATVDSKSKDYDWQIKSLLYYRALGDCMQNAAWGGDSGNGASNQQLSTADASSGKWFTRSTIKPAVGPYLRGVVDDNNDADVRAVCTNPNDLVKPALSLWRWSADEALCAFGAKRANGSPCLTADGGNGNFIKANLSATKYKQAVKSYVYGSSTEPDLSNDAYWYPFYLRVFQQSCAYSRSPVATAPSDVSSGSSVGYHLKEAQQDGTTKDIYYLGNLTRDHTISTRPAGIEGSISSASVDRTCAQIEGYVNQYASAFARRLAADPSLTKPEDASAVASTDNQTSCTIDGIGWILCPAMNFIGMITDSAYGVVSGMLTTSPSMFDTSQSTGLATQSAWTLMRNFANIAFVIVFLIIIFSQLTNFGVSNYGIKKMLPKLIIAAILVNISFYICAIAVDISNILGSSLKGILDNIASGVTITGNDTDFDKVFNGNGSLWTTIIGSLIATAAVTVAVLYAGLSVLLPLLIAALVAIVTVVVVLTMRQALIILLIVIAPLAFVALLLPNTEDWFKKWRKLFTTLLLMYPIIAIIFGASALAGKIVMGSSTNPLIQIMGAGVTIIPLFITPLVMKTAGGLLSRFGGIINNPNKGPFDRMRKRADSYRDRRQDMRAARAADGRKVFGRGQFTRKARRDFINNGAKNTRTRAEQKYTADLMTDENGNPTPFATKVAGGGAILGADPAALQRALASAQFTIDKAEAEDIQAESVTVRNMDTASLKDVLSGGQEVSDARKAAAMQRLVTISDPGDVLDDNGNVKSEGYARQVNAAMGGSETLRRATAEALAKNGPKFIKASDIDMIATGNHRQADGTQSTLESIASANVKSGVYSEEKMVDETSGNMKFAYKFADADGKRRMAQTAAALKENPILSGKIKHNAQTIDELASMAVATPQPARQDTSSPTSVPTGTAQPSTSPQPSPSTPSSGNQPTQPVIAPEWQDWHREARSDKTTFSVNNSGNTSVPISPQPQTPRDSQEQARAAAILNARAEQSAAANRGSSINSAGTQIPDGMSEEQVDKYTDGMIK